MPPVKLLSSQTALAFTTKKEIKNLDIFAPGFAHKRIYYI